MRRAETGWNGCSSADCRQPAVPAAQGFQRRGATGETGAVIFGTKKSWVQIPPPRPAAGLSLPGVAGKGAAFGLVALLTVFANARTCARRDVRFYGHGMTARALSNAEDVEP